ncbi:DUF421 domain-containing protein [Pelagerythrobacter rhizovicinus]|uniref:DUF421 domain-containing protein n=1 Tax=Pelagerythrobacter rhizovicinus TaxID=2268576 RepID=UPI001CDBD736|nr:YetF domain-containing protein [Pelagerythrobacter rhizovicinus]
MARGLLLAVAALAWVVLLVRVNGLRSLSKMTSFDFVMTIALGSLVAGASQADNWSGFAQPLVAMAGLFLAQWGAARLRRISPAIENVIQNEPVLLMRDGEILRDALDRTRVAESDLFAKLREANVSDLSQVRAVVLETTGDVSVLHGETTSERLLEGVEREN